jgi:hypothetical protein
VIDLNEGHFEYMRRRAAALKKPPPEPPKPVYAPGSQEYRSTIWLVRLGTNGSTALPKWR